MDETINYCPGCGQHVNNTYNYCPICGRCLRSIRHDPIKPSSPIKPIGPYFDPLNPLGGGPWMVTSKAAPPSSVEYI